MFDYEIVNQFVRICDYTGEDSRVEIPGEIDGLPVREIGAYAFSSKGITHLTLPETVEKIGRYAFYNSGQLAQVSFYSSIEDLGAGAFTGCHNVKCFQVQIVPEKPSCLKEFLSEISEEICVDYRDGEQFARLMFPEFYEEGVENTPARIIESHTHGSGIHYRNCFIRKEFQFEEYDKRFTMAMHRESFAFNLELVLGRLQYPYRLSEAAEEVYKEFLMEHFEEALQYLTEKKELEKMSFLMDFQRRNRKISALDFEL